MVAGGVRRPARRAGDPRALEGEGERLLGRVPVLEHRREHPQVAAEAAPAGPAAVEHRLARGEGREQRAQPRGRRRVLEHRARLGEHHAEAQPVQPRQRRRAGERRQPGTRGLGAAGVRVDRDGHRRPHAPAGMARRERREHVPVGLARRAAQQRRHHPLRRVRLVDAGVVAQPLAPRRLDEPLAVGEPAREQRARALEHRRVPGEPAVAQLVREPHAGLQLGVGLGDLPQLEHVREAVDVAPEPALGAADGVGEPDALRGGGEPLVDPLRRRGDVGHPAQHAGERLRVPEPAGHRDRLGEQPLAALGLGLGVQPRGQQAEHGRAHGIVAWWERGERIVEQVDRLVVDDAVELPLGEAERGGGEQLGVVEGAGVARGLRVGGAAVADLPGLLERGRELEPRLAARGAGGLVEVLEHAAAVLGRLLVGVRVHRVARGEHPVGGGLLGAADRRGGVEVVGQLGGARPARELQRLAHAAVQAHAPARARLRVQRLAHERVGEGEAVDHRLLDDEPRVDRALDRGQGLLRLVHDRLDDVQAELLAGDRRGDEHLPHVLAEPPHAAPTTSRTPSGTPRRRSSAAGGCEGSSACAARARPRAGRRGTGCRPSPPGSGARARAWRRRRGGRRAARRSRSRAARRAGSGA